MQDHKGMKMTDDKKTSHEGHNMDAMHSNADEGKAVQYTCPMHPEVVSDKPGNCPKCGMTLVPKKEMSDQKEMVINHYNTLYWTHATNIFLGFFLIAAPFTFGYSSEAMTYSDIISGGLLIVFSLLSANPFRLWAPWASSFVGVWLLFAPLAFWSPDASAYITDSIVGILAIGFSVLIPEMPGMMKMMMTMPARS